MYRNNIKWKERPKGRKKCVRNNTNKSKTLK